jgi:hypothetical protein
VKAIAATPLPWGLIPAAAAAAMGAAQLAKIFGSNPGFAMGTPGTSFVDFGKESTIKVHNREAIVNQAQGATLAEMVAGQVRDAVQTDRSGLLSEIKGMRSDARDRDRVLPIWIRDALLQGAV